MRCRTLGPRALSLLPPVGRSIRPAARTCCRLRRRAAFAALLTTAIAGGAPDCAAQVPPSFSWSVYTNVPGVAAANTTYQLTVDVTGCASLVTGSAAGAFAATATPAFGTPAPTISVANPAVGGGHQQASALFTGPTGASGSPVRIDVGGSLYVNCPPPSGGVAPAIGLSYRDRWDTPVVSGSFTVVPSKVGVKLAPGDPGMGVGASVLWGNPALETPDPSAEGLQHMSAFGYRIDATAQAAVAAHFGSMQLDIDMVRELGPDIVNQGFPGHIDVFDFGSAVLGPGQEATSPFGSPVANPTDLLLVQIVSSFDAPMGDLSAEPMEHWTALNGAALGVPEPAGLGLGISGSLLSAGTLARRRRQNRR